MENFVVVENGTDIQIEQRGLRNITFIGNSSSTTLMQSTYNMTEETNEEIDSVVRDVMETVLEEVERRSLISEEITLVQSTYNITEETDEEIDSVVLDVVETVLEEVERCSLISEEITQELISTGQRSMGSRNMSRPVSTLITEENNEELITEQPYMCTRSMRRRVVSKETQTETSSSTLFITSESSRYDIAIAALREIKNKVKIDIADLDKYIKEKFKANVPNLRKMLNAGIKKGIVDKSTGCKGRAVYQIKEKSTLDKKRAVSSTATDEETSQLDLTYKKTDTEAYFTVSQKQKPSMRKNKSEKSLVLEALPLFQNTEGVTAIKIRNIVNKKKCITLRRVRDTLEMCVQDNKVEMLQKGKMVLFKLI